MWLKWKIISISWKNVRENVIEKQIKEYYENYVYGNVEASQILITVDLNSISTHEEKTKT